MTGKGTYDKREAAACLAQGGSNHHKHTQPADRAEITRRTSHAKGRESNPRGSPTKHQDKDEARSLLEPPDTMGALAGTTTENIATPGGCHRRKTG